MVENTFIAGFDEAGLGPIIGPLVVSGVIVNSNDCARTSEYIRFTRDWAPLNLLKEKCHNVKDLHLRAN